MQRLDTYIYHCVLDEVEAFSRRTLERVRRLREQFPFDVPPVLDLIVNRQAEQQEPDFARQEPDMDLLVVGGVGRPPSCPAGSRTSASEAGPCSTCPTSSSG